MMLENKAILVDQYQHKCTSNWFHAQTLYLYKICLIIHWDDKRNLARKKRKERQKMSNVSKTRSSTWGYTWLCSMKPWKFPRLRRLLACIIPALEMRYCGNKWFFQGLCLKLLQPKKVYCHATEVTRSFTPSCCMLLYTESRHNDKGMMSHWIRFFWVMHTRAH